MAVSSNPEGRESSISNYYSYVNAFVGIWRLASDVEAEGCE